MVLITHAGPLPRLLHLPAGGTYTVREAGPEPVRCYRCNAYGHTQAKCGESTTCGVCSGRHSTRRCIEKHRQGERTVAKCVNCGNSHHVWFPGCPARLEELANYRQDRWNNHNKRRPRRDNRSRENNNQERRNAPAHQQSHQQQQKRTQERSTHREEHEQQPTCEAISTEEDRNNARQHHSQQEVRTPKSTKQGRQREHRLASKITKVETSTNNVGKNKKKEDKREIHNQKTRSKETHEKKLTHEPRVEDGRNRSSEQDGGEQVETADSDLERFALELSGRDLIRFADEMAEPIMEYCSKEKPEGSLEQLLHYILDGLSDLNSVATEIAKAQYNRRQRMRANSNTTKEPLATDNRPTSEPAQHVAAQRQH